MIAQCTYGDGPDILISLGKTKIDKLGLIDLTLQEAKDLKISLEMAICQCEEILAYNPGECPLCDCAGVEVGEECQKCFGTGHDYSK